MNSGKTIFARYSAGAYPAGGGPRRRGSASVVYAEHRLSTDADHILNDLRKRFDQVLAELESVAGWKTARVKRPVQIRGSLDGIETAVRQLIREEPLETTRIEYLGVTLAVPTEAEILRIKGFLILKRNATRDYLDLVALAEHLGVERTRGVVSQVHTIPMRSAKKNPAGARYDTLRILSSRKSRCFGGNSARELATIRACVLHHIYSYR